MPKLWGLYGSSILEGKGKERKYELLDECKIETVFDFTVYVESNQRKSDPIYDKLDVSVRRVKKRFSMNNLKNYHFSSKKHKDKKDDRDSRKHPLQL